MPDETNTDDDLCKRVDSLERMHAELLNLLSTMSSNMLKLTEAVERHSQVIMEKNDAN